MSEEAVDPRRTARAGGDGRQADVTEGGTDSPLRRSGGEASARPSSRTQAVVCQMSTVSDGRQDGSGISRWLDSVSIDASYWPRSMVRRSYTVSSASWTPTLPSSVRSSAGGGGGWRQAG